jgi:hypothetical protein
MGSENIPWTEHHTEISPLRCVPVEMTILSPAKACGKKCCPRSKVVIAFGFYPRTCRWVPHISLVFREMWDTTELTLKPSTESTGL